MAIGPNEPLSAARYLQEEVAELRTMIETGSGTGGINPAIINAKGDIVVGTANDVPGVISAGTNGQVLSADSSASTGLKWIDAPTGSGSSGVTSVNTRTGAVVLTKTDVGLSNVDNTADASKPVSVPVQQALNLKATASDLTSHLNDMNNPHSVTKTQIGLGNVDNTSDASKPISSATQTALNAKADLVGGKVPSSQLPPQTDVAGVQVWEWYVDTAVQGVGSARKYNDSGQSLTVVSVRVRANINTPVGSNLVVDLNKNGSTIFTTQSNRPTVIDGTQDSGRVTSMNVTSLAAGDYLVPDIDSVGSVVPGSGILIAVTLR